MNSLELTKTGKSKVLLTQIEATEYLILQRRRRIDARTVILVNKVNKRIANPTTLLMAIGIGFLIAEFTKCANTKAVGATDNPSTNDSSPLKIAFNLLMSARTLYMALPVAWVMKASQKRSQV